VAVVAVITIEEEGEIILISESFSMEMDPELLSVLEKHMDDAVSIDRSRHLDTFSPFPDIPDRSSRVIPRKGKFSYLKNKPMSSGSEWKIEKYLNVLQDVTENGIPTHSTISSQNEEQNKSYENIEVQECELDKNTSSECFSAPL